MAARLPPTLVSGLPRLGAAALATVFCLGLQATSAGLAQESPRPVAPAAGAKAGAVLHVRLQSVVHPVAAQFLTTTLAAADAEGAALVVIELDTPGGLLTSTREISTAMLGATTPVAVYVGPSGAQAASAGFFLLMAADFAAMAPGTNTGAAHPVGGQGETIEGVMGKKVEEDAAATIRALAGRHGRNVTLAQAAVVESRSFTDQEALAAGLVDVVAADLPTLLRELAGRPCPKVGETGKLDLGVPVVREVRMSRLQSWLAVLVHPNIAYLLMAIGMLGIYFELAHPGAILPGVVGGIALVLGLYAMSVLPVNFAGVGLLALAAIFFVAEIKVTSYGLLGLGGIIALVLGSSMLFREVDPALELSRGLIAATALTAGLVVGFLALLAARAQRSPVASGNAAIVGEIGKALGALAPSGRVFVHGEIWNADADEPVEAGRPVRVVGVEGLRLRVRPEERN